MKQFSFRNGESGPNLESLTPESFVTRYFETTESFKTMVNDLEEFAPKMRSDLESCLHFTQRGYKVNSVVRERRHQQTDMPYIHLTMSLRNGDVPMMLFSQGRLKDFLLDYQAGKVKVEFSFQELMTYINS